MCNVVIFSSGICIEENTKSVARFDLYLMNHKKKVSFATFSLHVSDVVP